MAQKFNFTQRQAQKRNLPLRLMVFGVSGGGKTYTALELATELRRLSGDARPISVLDTEKSASKYADIFDFQITEAGPNSEDGIFTHHPEMFTAWINHYGSRSAVLVIDSFSHEWTGEQGCLQLVQDFTTAKYGGNSYMAWNEVTPMHNAVIQAIISCPAHIIISARGKSAYALEDRRGKKVPVKIGVGYIGRDGLEYEVDVSLQASEGGALSVDKTRAPVLQGRVFNRDVPTLAKIIHGWLNSGEAVERYIYGDGTETKNHPATRRIFGEFVAEFDRVPNNSEELKEYHTKRTTEERVNNAPDVGEQPAEQAEPTE